MSESWVSIGEIIVGQRLRQDFGDIKALAASIDKHGLFHPIVVDADNHLIAGERRLRAMELLGWSEVEVRRFEELSESERRVLELEENLLRKDLTPYERSRNLVELAAVAEQVDRDDESSRAESAQLDRRPQRQPQPGSSRRVAERIGVPDTTIREAKKHVAVADEYPVLQQPGWKQYQAMEAAEVLNQLPEKEREPIIDLIDQPGIHPKDAISILHNVADKSDVERRQIINLAKSDDTRERSLALTKAAEQPPMPDGRAIQLKAVVRDIQKCIRIYPDDPEVAELAAIVQKVEAVIAAIEERHRRRVESAA